MSAGAGLHFFLSFAVGGTAYSIAPALLLPQKKRDGNRDLPIEFLNFASLNQEGGTAGQ